MNKHITVNGKEWELREENGVPVWTTQHWLSKEDQEQFRSAMAAWKDTLQLAESASPRQANRPPITEKAGEERDLPGVERYILSKYASCRLSATGYLVIQSESVTCLDPNEALLFARWILQQEAALQQLAKEQEEPETN